VRRVPRVVHARTQERAIIAATGGTERASAGGIHLAEVFGDGARVPDLGGTGIYEGAAGQVVVRAGELYGEQSTLLTSI
jgi:hypothetical protein